MAKITDITGTIHTGMWHYEEPFPEYSLEPIAQPEWLEYPVYMENFNGMCSQTGTYLETPAHSVGYEKSYPLISVSLDELVDVPVCLIQVDPAKLPEIDGRRAITKEALMDSTDKQHTAECSAIIVSTGWGSHWGESTYLDLSPFFKNDAMQWLISRNIRILGSDTPRWENLEHPEGFFPAFYEADILMLAPVVNVESIDGPVGKLTVLPLKIEKTCCVPCRAVVKTG